MIGVAYDYSAGKPGAAAIQKSGALGAIRYIGFPDRSKCTNRAEFVDFDDHNLGMALVFENNTTDWRGGYGAGLVSGRRGRDHANAIRFPADRPIYMAVDQDVVRLGEFAIMIEYLRGAGASLGGVEATGVYGEADVIDRARDAGVASYFWQTAAWSQGRRAKNLNLFQKIGAVKVAGIDCDINEVLTPDWGQHNAGDDMAPTQAEFDNLMDGYLKNRFAPDGRNLLDLWKQTGAWAGAGSDDEEKIIAAVKTMIASERGDLLEAIAAIKPGEPVTDEQVIALGDKLNAQLGGQWQLNITRTQA